MPCNFRRMRNAFSDDVKYMSPDENNSWNTHLRCGRQGNIILRVRDELAEALRRRQNESGRDRGNPAAPAYGLCRFSPHCRALRHAPSERGRDAEAATGAACALLAALPGLEFLEEVVTLVVHEDEGGEVLDGDLPDGLHAELGIFDALDAVDAALRENGCHAADGA